MLMWTRKRIFTLAIGMGAAISLHLATGCGSNAAEVKAGLTGSTKKVDGEPCAKDTECVNQCLTAAEADAQPTTKPNTCGRATRVSN